MRWRSGLIALVALSCATGVVNASAEVTASQARTPGANGNAIQGQLPDAIGSTPSAAASSAAVLSGGATRLVSVSTSDVNGRTTVTLRGNGRLVAKGVEDARDLPPRVFVNLPGVEAGVPLVTPVNSASVARVRVAANSAAPLVTRVVLDLKRKAPYTVEHHDDEIVLTVGVDVPAPAVTSGASPVVIVPAAYVAPVAAAAAPAAPPAPVRRAAAPAAPPAPVRRAAPLVAAPGTIIAFPAAATSKAATFVAPSPAPPVHAPAVEGVPSLTTASVNRSSLPRPARTPVSRTTGQAKSIASPAVSPAAPVASEAVATASAAVQSAPGTVPPTLGDSPEARSFTGHPVTLDFQGVDLRAVLRTFSEITGLNIVIDPSVQGTVDVALKEVPWDQALDIILRANQLGYTVEGNIVRIAPLPTLVKEQEEKRKLSEAVALSGDLDMLTRGLSYAKAEEMTALLTRAALTSKGSIHVDKRTNTLIIRDLPIGLDAARQLIDTLDQPQPQVEIEARIVQTNRNFLRELGVQWGIGGEASQRLGNPTGLVYPNNVGVAGSTTLPTTNAPQSVIGLVTSSVNGAFRLDVALSAAERQGKVRILSTPRVSTQNNVEAEISQGTQIPVQTVANNTVTVTFKDATLTLKVRPQITAANTVIMNVVVENGSPDYSRQVNGIPPIDTQRANTQVQVNDGATTVIGGIFVSSERDTEDRTPGLHRVPLLGWLFKSQNKADSSQELLIFLTPRIIKG